jgi:two-component system, cell cycle sensor histidine kinase PleC
MEQGIYGPLGSPRYDEYMADIRKSGEYLLGVISDLLNMSKIEAGTLKLDLRVDEITAPIALAIDSVRPAAAGKQIRIETEFGDDVHACFDNKAATHIFSHLFQNSVKFTRGGGKIITRTRVKNGYMHVFIADNGVGMAPDVLAGVGKPFDQRAQSLNNGMKGSGLGLAIAHSLCELHGGALSIRSKIQRGTVVRVKLPLEPDMSWSQNETSEDDPSDSMSHFPFEQGMDKAA